MIRDPAVFLATIKTKKPSQSEKAFRDGTRIRTWDRLLRRQVLYPAELCHRFAVANISHFINNTMFFSLKNPSTLEIEKLPKGSF